ncbi:MAG TPA: ATP-binding protein [Anaerolineales bacterium]
MQARRLASGVLQYILAAVLIAATTLLFSTVRGVLDTPVIALLLIIPVGLSTAFWGLGPGIAAALCAFLGFNYFFISPYYTFAVHRPEDVVVLLVFLIVAVVVSQLVGRAQAGMATARAREQEATQLYELSTALAGEQDDEGVIRTLARQTAAALGAEAVQVELTGPPRREARAPEGTERSEGLAAAAGPDRPPDMVISIQAIRGVLGEVRLWGKERGSSSSERRLLQAFAGQGALALERAGLSRTESRAKLLEESDRFKSSLLSSVSHELRSPLATIKAAASSLRGGEVSWDSPARAELLAAIDEEADHLNILVGNLLDMSRIESGALKPDRQWNVLPEIVGSVAARMRRDLESHKLEIHIPEDLPLVPVDFVQIEQVFTNLISNSVKYAPAGSMIRIEAQPEEAADVLIRVENQGPPVPAEHLDRIFDKFYRITAADRVTGTGLGLSICKGIIEAHGGRIWATNLPDGFSFNFTLPLTLDGSPPPELRAEPEAT